MNLGNQDKWYIVLMLFIWLLLSFAILILGAHFLIDGATNLAKRLGVSPLIIGLTVVAFGTSLPELAVNTQASLIHDNDLVIGNIIGSNIANILLILGLAAITREITVRRETANKHIPIMIGSTLLVVLLAGSTSGGLIRRVSGVIFLGVFGLFIWYVMRTAKKNLKTSASKMSLPACISSTLLGLALLIVGGVLAVHMSQSIARSFGISERVIALSIVAIGTSLPELATSVVAAYKRHSDIAIGNIVGSNIINVLFIFGLSAVIHPIYMNQRAMLDTGFLLLISILLLACMFVGKKYRLTKVNGLVFLSIFVIYVASLIRWA
ncbi:MAG: calcium/sodium antiporter [Candidatus Saccharibacteria bacterium]